MNQCLAVCTCMNPLVLSAQLTGLSQAKLALHLVSVYVNFVAAVAYFMMWSGFSPILMDTGSCLWVWGVWGMRGCHQVKSLHGMAGMWDAFIPLPTIAGRCGAGVPA